MAVRKGSMIDRTPELARRAEITSRYVAIPFPTLEDDERFAAELGLSRDSLYRLAAAWRRHGDPEALQGSRVRAEANAVPLAVATASGTLDLSGVSPTRRLQTRRRIEIIRDYLQIERPAKADVVDAAALIGVRPYRFKRMVKIWLLYRDPAALPGAVIPKRRSNRLRPAVDEVAEKSVADAILELGADASCAAVHARTEQICQDRQCKVPSRSTVYNRLKTERLRTPPASEHRS